MPSLLDYTPWVQDLSQRVLEIHWRDGVSSVTAPVSSRELAQIHVSPVFSRGAQVLYLVVGPARLQAYDTRTGQVLWDVDLSNNRGHGGVATLLDVRSGNRNTLGVLTLTARNDVALAVLSAKDGTTASFHYLPLKEGDRAAMLQGPVTSQWRLIDDSFVVSIGSALHRLSVLGN